MQHTMLCARLCKRNDGMEWRDFAGGPVNVTDDFEDFMIVDGSNVRFGCCN